ncbi:MAG: xanthine dehydrogenase accessory protein XdhC [Shimia thalassica]|uniref:xanthine dehydrogenase accessory protein XdhC n=1 Tax=Shimia thalassica TaxID=1715693 RepID=UPI0032992994
MARATLAGFFGAHEKVIEVTLSAVSGSSPRDGGTSMFVARDGLFGTIGGGQLEYMVIDEARSMLSRSVEVRDMNVPLGPEIGQCCGGRVVVSLRLATASIREAALEKEQADETALPHVYLLGAGHVGRALAVFFQHMPVRCILIDQRKAELALSTADVERRLSVMPEQDISQAPAGSAFIVLTHDHALDFLLASVAIQREDAAYVGMIGSKTKRARFTSWCNDFCDGLSVASLICPIGAGGSRDKRPSVIAAQVAAEVITVLTSEPAAASAPKGADEPSSLDDPLVRQRHVRKGRI